MILQTISPSSDLAAVALMSKTGSARMVLDMCEWNAADALLLPVLIPSAVAAPEHLAYLIRRLTAVGQPSLSSFHARGQREICGTSFFSVFSPLFTRHFISAGLW
jgi:hypothetical protein